ncbi:cell division protein FtsA [bacterium]|nr:cell division protein FtsA [candidate division CSSED10-310 bacterium]
MTDTTERSTGLSLGTTSVSMAVVQHHPPDRPELLAFDRVPCRFLRDGLIVNLEALEDAVNVCRSNIQSLVRSPIRTVTVNLCGVQCRSVRGTVTHAFKKRREIGRKHLPAVEFQARVIEDPDWHLIHSFPESYSVDDQSGLTSPVGMIGKSLSADIQQIFAPGATMQNILHALKKCRFAAAHIVVDPLAALESLVTPDEREIGICLLDIGGSVTQMASAVGRQVRIPPPMFIGSDLVTSDIAIGLNTTIKDAERIKIDHGCALTALASDDRKIQIPPLGGGQAANPTSQQRIAEIIQSRIEELLEIVADHMDQLELPNHYTSGIILTGGGSMLRGTSELAEKILGMPVIRGHLRDVGGMTDIAPVPLAASAVGLALYGLRHPQNPCWEPGGVMKWKRFTRTVFFWLGGDQ